MERRKVKRWLAAVALWIGCGSGLEAQITLTTGLIGHWTFDEGSGTAVGDSSGQGNSGTLVNGAGAWTTGHFGGALYFGGTTGAASTRVEIPNTTALQNAITTAVSFASWVRVDDIGRDAPILTKEGPAGLSFWFGAYGLTNESSAPGNFGLLLDTGGGQPWTLYDRDQGSITQGSWVHVASVWNGSNVTHYLNGNVVAGGESLSATLSTTTDKLVIGVNAGYVTESNATAFKGIIDDLYFYDRALSATEINQVMNGAAVPEPSTWAALAGLAALAFSTWRRRKRMWCKGNVGSVLVMGWAAAGVAFDAGAQTFVQWTVASGGNGHYYALTASAADWQSAENYGLARGGHLASITSAPEQSFINSTFLTGAFANQPLWIGLTDTALEGTFSWTTGETVSYTNWRGAPNFEPNNFGSGEDYVAINWYATSPSFEYGTWNDTPLNGTSGFAAEGRIDGPYYGIIEVTAVPEPSTYAALAGLAALGLAAVRRRRWRRRQTGRG